MIRLKPNRRNTSRREHRDGTVVPFLIATVLLLLLVSAWVIDRAWVSSAYGEMVSASESAAHAAAIELLDDTRLLTVGEELRLRRARYAASEIAASHVVAGSHVLVDPEQDVLFAKADGKRWEKDVIDPRLVAVACGRSSDRGNRLGLLLSGIGGVDSTEISHVAKVRIDNAIIALHADESRPLAMLPIAISARGTESVLGWDDAITDQLGEDNYSFRRDDQAVHQTADGLPEIAVVIGDTPDANAQFVSHAGFEEAQLLSLIADGYTGGQIGFASFAGLQTSGTAQTAVMSRLGQPDVLGRKRVLFLTDGNQIVRAVAGRVMAVTTDGVGRTIAIIQPCVMALAQAVTVDSRAFPESNMTASQLDPNPYFYKLTTVR